MRPQLNRGVFRKLLANEPIAHHGCLRRPQLHLASCPPETLALPRAQRRSFFNIFQKPPRVNVDPKMAPGMEKMMEYSKMERLNARLPPPDDVLKAVIAFFQYKASLSTDLGHVSDLQAQHLLRNLHYLRQHGQLSTLKPELFRDFFRVLGQGQPGDSSIHRDVIDLLYKALNQVTDRSKLHVKDFQAYLDALCATGGTMAARDVFTQLDKNDSRHLVLFTHDRCHVLWKSILKGFASEKNELELLRSRDIIIESGMSGNYDYIYEVILEFYISQQNIDKAYEWYAKCKQRNLKPRNFVNLQKVMVDLCIQKAHPGYGKSIIRDITAGKPTKVQWDLILKWAAAMGKGADELDRMIGVMERANQNLPEAEWLKPDTTTINKLVKVAVDRKDPYLAERFLSLAKARNIPPDAQTYIYQMQYRLHSKDVDGALNVYKHMQSQDLSLNRDVGVVNQLIHAMCTTGRQDFESIMNVAADLSDRQARFEPATVSALAMLHLSRDEVHDVIDLLNTHVHSFDLAGRASVQEKLIEFCLQPSTTTAQAWDAYVILKQIFDETSREQRVKIMNDFFRRQRPDMAVHVFNHMRAHTRAELIPTVDTYAECLSGIGKLKDEESLEVVHNQLKLDYNIEPNTHLYNALIRAYTLCGKPRAALGFWDDIALSREGPTIDSIHLALKACEDSPWGDEKARQIWTKLSRSGIELDQTLWASYAGALIGNGNVQAAINLLEEAHFQQGLDMDTLL
jgi:hypothetical protein